MGLIHEGAHPSCGGSTLYHTTVDKGLRHNRSPRASRAAYVLPGLGSSDGKGHKSS